MKPVEFRSQIFRDSAQWQYGLSYRLNLRDNGVALFSRPAFTGWATQAEEARGAKSLAVDECGCIFWINPQNCRLYRYDPTSGLVEVMTQLAQCNTLRNLSDLCASAVSYGDESVNRRDAESAEVAQRNQPAFKRMLIVERRLWILDRDGSRVIALRPDTFQIITEISVSNPIDIAWSAGRLLVLDHNGISAYDVNGKPLHLQQRCTPATVALGADPKGQWIYVVDSFAKGFLRFKADGSFADEIGVFSDVEPCFRPRLLALNPGGSLFACDESAIAHQFSADGGYIGDTGDLVPLSGISAITFGPSGDLYAAAPEGIARFGSATGLAGNEGVFYTRTLDSGCDDVDCWHRLDLTADLESGGALDVRYATASSKDAALVNAVNNVFAKESPLQEKVATLETLLEDRWQTPDELRATADATPQASLRERPTHSMLFRAQTSRYLWLKLTLSGLASGSRASVSSMRVYYPRLSYLRYLPAVYQENEVSKEFLGRYLSLFETVFSGLEATIETIPEVFDPERTPKEFLDWLGQWLDLGIEEDWKPEVKRKLIRKASSLYQKKGTPAALTEFIEIVIGRPPLIRESFQVERPFILGEGRSLGNETYVFPQPVKPLPREQRTVLGCSSILGRTLISESATVPINPFRAAAHHFTVLLDLSPLEFQRHERGLHRIIRENSPAHVGYDIRLVSDVGLGPNLMLGINFRVQDPQPFNLGHSSLGRSVLSRFRYGPELGIDTLVTGSSCGSNDAALFYGEQ